MPDNNNNNTPTWKASRISATMAQNVQVQAGTLLNAFDIASPAAPADSAIICATSGDFSFSCVPETQDFYEDVNNAPNNTKEGKEITGWDCSLTVNCIEITNDTLLLALGAADVGADGGVHPRKTYSIAQNNDDFKQIYWIGDMKDENKLFVIAMDNTVSTGGISLTTAKNSKGQLALTLTPHATIADIEKVPMAFYILTKA